MNRPFFSVITVCYNAGDRLSDAVKALRAQTCGDYQHIIKDGGSTDGSVESARSLTQGDGRTVIISRPDGGIYDAMNQALSEAEGEYVYFLNCGDTFYDCDVLSDVKRFIEEDLPDGAVNPRKTSEIDDRGDRCSNDGGMGEKDPFGAVIYGDFMLRGEKIRQPKRIDAFYLFRRPLNHQSAFFSREIFRRLGGFDTIFRIRADHELLVHAYRRGAVFMKIDRLINVYEGGGFSESAEMRDTRRRELIDIRRRHYTEAEIERYGKRLHCRLGGLRSRMSSENNPEMIRKLYRGIANLFNH